MKNGRYGLVDVATGYRLDGRGSIPSKGKIFLFSIASRPALGPTHPPLPFVPVAISLELKRPWRESDYSPLSSAEVKNGGAAPLLSHMFSWHGA
jgi:hypothetical protein